jgi:hypothetical protein
LSHLSIHDDALSRVLRLTRHVSDFSFYFFCHTASFAAAKSSATCPQAYWPIRAPAAYQKAFSLASPTAHISLTFQPDLMALISVSLLG